MQNLRDQFDVTEESDDFGIEMYLNVKRYVKNLIVWNYIGNLEYVQMLLVLIPDVKFVSNLFSNIEIRCFYIIELNSELRICSIFALDFMFD